MVEKHDKEFTSGLKKHVWAKIATEMTKITSKHMTWEQLDSKWKGLKKTYKKVKSHNSQSGNSLKIWHFFHAMDAFLCKKPEINPVAVCTSMSEKVQTACTSISEKAQTEGRLKNI